MTANLPDGRLVAARRDAEEIAPRVPLAAGRLREVLVVTGLPLTDLVPGTRLRAGTAVIELTGADDAGGLEDAEDRSARVGARVVEAGAVAIGDPVAIEAVPVPLEDALDLHPFAPAEIADVVREYLDRARAAGLGEVRLVHGRGRGVQRETVRRVLAGSPVVLGFADAPPERGGWGATIAILRPR